MKGKKRIQLTSEMHPFFFLYDRIPSEAIFEQIAVSNCSAYDCEYVALARDLGTKLVTADENILKEFPSTCISLPSFSEN